MHKTNFSVHNSIYLPHPRPDFRASPFRRGAVASSSMCPAPSSGRKVSAKGLRKELGDSFQIPYSLSFLYSTQKQKNNLKLPFFGTKKENRKKCIKKMCNMHKKETSNMKVLTKSTNSDTLSNEVLYHKSKSANGCRTLRMYYIDRRKYT